jgi:hypothetical protein
MGHDDTERTMTKWLLTLAAIGMATSARADDWYAKAVKAVTLAVEPASAGPGQVVAVKLTVSLNDTFHTYPTVQPDRNAKEQVCTIALPPGDADGLIFVGSLKQPPNPSKKAEPLLGIRELHTYAGDVTFVHNAVVSPKAKAGAKAVKLAKVSLLVCDDANCYPAKALTPEAKWTACDAPAVAVPEEHRKAVEAVVGK